MAFDWVSMERQENALKQAQVDEIRLRSGVYDLGYVQEREGIPEEHRPEAAPAPTRPTFQLAADGGAAPAFFRQAGWEGYG